VLAPVQCPSGNDGVVRAMGIVTHGSQRGLAQHRRLLGTTWMADNVDLRGALCGRRCIPLIRDLLIQLRTSPPAQGRRSCFFRFLVLAPPDRTAAR
jgi:hypothetical protein